MRNECDMTKPDRPKVEILKVIGEGNYLQKQRRNFYIPRTTFEMLHELALMDGVSHSDEINLIVRRAYREVFGRVIPVPILKKGLEDDR